MAYKIEVAEIPALLKVLETWKLECYNTYHIIQNCYKTKNKYPYLEDIFVDTKDVTEMTSMVAIWYQDIDPPEKWHFVFTLNDKRLNILIRTPGVITMTTGIKIMFRCEGSSVQVVTDLVSKEMGLQPSRVHHMYTYIHSNLEEVRVYISNRPIPPNFKIAPLEVKHAEMMQAYRKPTYPLQRYENLIRFHYTMAVYNDQDNPIAWVAVKEYGDIGYTSTKPGYRRRGFASLLIAIATKELHERDEVPYVKIDTDNKHSIDMHTKLGFQQRDGDTNTIFY